MHSWKNTARTIWPEARYIAGDGPVATVRNCWGRLTVVLHATREEAEAVPAHSLWYDYTCCSGDSIVELAK